MRARALCFVAPRRVEVVDVDVPAPSEGEVLVRSLFSGVSAGTEMLVYRGDLDPAVALDERIASLRGTFTYPLRFGYSNVGRVERSEAAIPPGTLVFAFHPHQDLFVAPVSDVVALDDDVEPRIATLFPHVEVALQVSLDAGTLRHECVPVMGLGAVGLLAAALLVRSGADAVGVDPLPWRSRAAEGLGVPTVAPEALAQEVERRTEGRGAPVVVEASGNSAALEAALGLLAHEGVALVVSWYGTKQVALPLGGAFHRRRLSIRSTQVSTIPAHLSGRWTIDRRRTVAASLLRELPLSALATHEYPFEQAAAAFAAVDRGLEGLVHAALRYATR